MESGRSESDQLIGVLKKKMKLELEPPNNNMEVESESIIIDFMDCENAG